MIGVGINENVVIKSVSINDKKTLEIELAEASKSETAAVVKNVFDELLTARTAEDSSIKFLVRVFGLKVSDKEDKTADDKIALISADIKKVNKQLGQFLEQYMPVDQIDLDRIQFDETGITRENAMTTLLDQDCINRVFDNICKRFVELIKPHLNSDPLRVKLVRQSADKHYATLPSRYLNEQPFVELMLVPKEQSRVKFTVWEIQNGFDNGAPIAKETAAETKKAPEADVNPFAP